MHDSQNRSVLIIGASFAGLSSAHWMRQMGYDVTLVEIASGLRKGGTAVDIVGGAVAIAERMGILESIRVNRLNLRQMEFKSADDQTERTIVLREKGQAPAQDEFEIERNVLLNILFDRVRESCHIEFENSVGSMRETADGVDVTFTNGRQAVFDLVLGCDGLHSKVRQMWFGEKKKFSYFLQQYFSITIIDKLLIERDTVQIFSVPGKSAMLNAYKNNTDIIFGFVSDDEISYDRHDEAQQQGLIARQFADQGWRTQELLREMEGSTNFYFDKLSQIRMPSWSRGRVALVGDAAYCASPASGMGGSLAIEGAAALADALQTHGQDHRLAFDAYGEKLRPFIDEVQARAIKTGLETLVPRTEAAIRRRNARKGNEF